MKMLFICDEFTLDLTGKELDWTEENSWFHDEFILNSTFPSDLDYTENAYFIIYKYYNASTPRTRFDGVLQKRNGKISPAYLEITNASNKLKFTIRDGLETFPTWNKMLTQLDLGIVNPPEGMLTHAMSIIPQTYPAVMYNFPAIQCHDLYKDAPGFEAFHGYYNKLNVDGTAFIPNIEVPELNTFANHNIVYPMPYWLHILRTGIEEAGFSLHGDILEDPEFTRAIMPIRKIEMSERPETLEWIIGEVDVVENESMVRSYHSEVTLQPNTRYRIKGNLYYVNDGFQGIMHAIFMCENVHLYMVTFNSPQSAFAVDFTIEPSPHERTLVFGGGWRLFEMNMPDVFEGLVIPTHIYDEDGNLIPALADFNNVDLAAMLPEITFGDLVKIIKAWKNYDFDLIEGKRVVMNLVEKEMVRDNPVDLRGFEVQFPERKYEQQGSYVLKFSEENEEHPFVKTFVNLDSILTSTNEADFPTNDQTKDIVINAVPLPVLPLSAFGEGEGHMLTSKLITDDPGKPCLVLYDGLNSEGQNWTSPIDDLMTPVLVEKHWFRFMMFMIKSVLYGWRMDGLISEFSNLTRKSIIFVYNNYMVVKSLHRKQSKNKETIEIKARTF